MKINVPILWGFSLMDITFLYVGSNGCNVCQKLLLIKQNREICFSSRKWHACLSGSNMFSVFLLLLTVEYSLLMYPYNIQCSYFALYFKRFQFLFFVERVLFRSSSFFASVYVQSSPREEGLRFSLMRLLLFLILLVLRSSIHNCKARTIRETATATDT